MEKQNPRTQLTATTTTSTPPESTAPSMASLDIKPRRNNYAVACAMLASMTSVVCGYDIGVMSGAQIFIKEDLKATDTQIEILAGVINLCSLLGSLAAGRTSDWMGRHYTVALAAAIFFAGALTMGLAPDYGALMAGRLVGGVGVGCAVVIAPVYTAELSPAASRGTLASFPEVFGNFGVLLGYVANLAFARLPLRLGWRAMFLAGAVPPVFIGAGVLAMPESPRWLVMRGRLDDARRVLARTTSGPDEAELRLQDIKASLDENAKRSGGDSVWRELLLRPTPSVRRILLAALGLQFFQQASGIDSVVLYSPRVFEKAGIRSASNSLGATVAVGFTKTAFILVATFLLDRVGRRPLLLSSAAGMVASLLTLASALRIIDDRTHDHGSHHGGGGVAAAPAAGAVAIAAVLGFVGSFSIGLGPIAWVYSSEIFPLRLRAQGASMGAAVNRVMSGVITMTFISLYKAITISGSFFLYAGVAAAGWVFFYAFLPETRGRSLEDIDVLFGKKRTEEAEAAEENTEKGGEEGTAAEIKGDADESSESQENKCQAPPAGSCISKN